MHISSTAFLFTLLSASTFTAPIDGASLVDTLSTSSLPDTNATDSSFIEARDFTLRQGYVGSVWSKTCIGRPLGISPPTPEMSCVKFQPESDHVAVVWVSPPSLPPLHSSLAPCTLLPSYLTFSVSPTRLPFPFFVIACNPKACDTNSYAQPTIVNGGSLMVFSDDVCENQIGATIIAPLDKTPLCINWKAHVGASKKGWRSVKHTSHWVPAPAKVARSARSL